MRRSWICAAMMIVVLMTPTSARAAPDAVLVKDGLPPARELTDLGGVLFFAVGPQLWKSDGTSSGTVMVKNLNQKYLYGLTAVQDTLFFAGNDGSHGYELWKSDGTAAGTRMVKDIYPGEHRSLGNPSADNGNFDNSPFLEVGGILYFAANDGVHGRELWRSDARRAGTVMVKDIKPGSQASTPDRFVDQGGRLLFVARDGKHGAELWRSDGTAAGTALVEDIYPVASNSSTPTDLTDVGDRVFFTADDGTHGRELWRSDGTPDGTEIIADIAPGGSSSSPYYLTAVGDTVFFGAFRTFVDGESGQLWKSDGTAQGTVSIDSDVTPYSLADLDGTTLLFYGKDGEHGYELWRSNGTPAGTFMVKDISPGPTDSGIVDLSSIGGRVYFSPFKTEEPGEPWVSDGTADGTALIEVVTPSSPGGLAWQYTGVGSVVYFTACVQAVCSVWAVHGQ